MVNTTGYFAAGLGVVTTIKPHFLNAHTQLSGSNGESGKAHREGRGRKV